MTQYKKFVLEMKQFHHEKCACFSFVENILDAFFFDVLNTQKTYEDLWTTVKFLLTLSHGQAAVARGFSVNKEALVPNLKEDSLKVICLVPDTISAEQFEIAEFVITDELPTSCSHASSRYKMCLMDKYKEAQEPKNAKKRKALGEELTEAKKRKREVKSYSMEVSRVS